MRQVPARLSCCRAVSLANLSACLFWRMPGSVDTRPAVKALGHAHCVAHFCAKASGSNSGITKPLLTGVRPPVLCARADIRRQLWEYDQVLNTQRDRVYLERRRALLSRDLSPLLLEYAERTVDDILEARALCQKRCQKS